jgi:hypothetical protein
VAYVAVGWNGISAVAVFAVVVWGSAVGAHVSEAGVAVGC